MSVLRRSPSSRRVLGGDRIVRTAPAIPTVLSEAVWWIDAALSTGTQTVSYLGTGGAALNAQLGSTTGADSNDPQLLKFTGTQYLALPGSGTNYASTPDAAALDLTTELDIRCRVALADWTPATATALVAKFTTTGNQRSYSLTVDTSGNLVLTLSVDGTATTAATSSAATSHTDNATYWVRATWRASDGRVQFFTAADNPSIPAAWTQLGTDQTAAIAGIYASTAVLEVGSLTAGTSNFLNGRAFYAEVRSAIDGTVVAKFEPGISVEPHTSWVATTGETWTVNRAASGRKSVLVDRSLWLLGTDDYFEVADNALLDFALADSFSAMAVLRQPSFTASSTLIAKRAASDSAASVGWHIRSGAGTPAQGLTQIADGTNQQSAATGSRSAGVTSVVVGVRNTTTDLMQSFLDGTGGATPTDNTTATLANSEVLRVGRLSGAGTYYLDGEVIAAAVWRRALTAAEVTAISSYYNTRRL